MIHYSKKIQIKSSPPPPTKRLIWRSTRETRDKFPSVLSQWRHMGMCLMLPAMMCDNVYKVLTAGEVDAGPSWFQLEKLTWAWVFTGGVSHISMQHPHGWSQLPRSQPSGAKLSFIINPFVKIKLFGHPNPAWLKVSGIEQYSHQAEYSEGSEGIS